MKSLIKYYNHIFFWMVMAIPLIIQFSPRANKFDLVEQFLPVMVIAFFITVGCIKGWGLSAYKHRKKKESFFKGPDLFPVIALTAFVLWSTLSFMLADVRTFGFTEIYMLWAGTLIFIYFSTCLTETGKSKVTLLKRHLPLGLSLLLIINAVGGVYGFLTTDHTRFFGLFYNPEIKADAWPNAYALFFILTFPFLLYRFFNRNFEKYKDNLEGTEFGMTILKLVLTGFIYGTFLIVFSRAGYIAFGIELILLALFISIHLWPISKKHIIHWIIGSLVVAIVGWGTASGLQEWKSMNWETTNVSERLSFGGDQGAASFSERLEFFEGSMELSKRKPFFGYGPASFKWVYPQVQQGFLSLSDHPHNWPLKLSVERGAPAAAFFLLFILVIFLRVNPFSKNTSMFTKMAWAGLLAALAHQLVDHNFNFITNYILFWLIAAALVAEAKENKKYKSHTLSALIAIVLIASLLFSSLKIVKDTWQYRWQDRESAQNSLAPYDIDYLKAFNPLLPRWWFLRLDDKFSQWENLEDGFKAREIVLRKQSNYNSYDAEAYSRLGQMHLDGDGLEAALAQFKKAIEVNPKNTFEYYNWYVLTALSLGDKEAVSEIRPIIEKLIKEYMPLYEQNLHFTQRDGEMEYIDELKRVLSIY